MRSKALEVNLTDTQVHVVINKKYDVLLEIVKDYAGILKKMDAFLTELCSNPLVDQVGFELAYLAPLAGFWPDPG